jgi:hypothetical protein
MDNDMYLFFMGYLDIFVIVEINRSLLRRIDYVGYRLVLYHEAVMFTTIGLQNPGLAVSGVSSDVSDDLT